MGDRRNIEVKQSSGSVFLYTHWCGTELPTILAEALDSIEGRNRWGDESYLTRIIFCRMLLQGNNSETGFGISTEEIDPNRKTLVVDVKNQTVDGKPFKKFIAFHKPEKKGKEDV